jgi:predicted TIM-barrel fold metal-dependent hydrolase
MKNKIIKLYALLCIPVFLQLGCSKNHLTEKQITSLVEKYKDITIVDAHNHDAAGYRYKESLAVWNKYGIDKIVLFGYISEPHALISDKIAFDAYLNNKDRFIPFIAGINVHDSTCLNYIKSSFDSGFFGIGEVVAASTYSPIASKCAWKGEYPMDGYFPEIYELCGKYGKPIILHIDPPDGFPIEKLKEAALKYPETNFIFGHANAYTSPSDLEELLENYKNIYIDFFAGFTAYNPDSKYTLADFVPLINKYPDKFMISTDSGYGIGYEKAYSAIYELFDLLEKDVVIKIAGRNILNLVGVN